LTELKVKLNPQEEQMKRELSSDFKLEQAAEGLGLFLIT